MEESTKKRELLALDLHGFQTLFILKTSKHLRKQLLFLMICSPVRPQIKRSGHQAFSDSTTVLKVVLGRITASSLDRSGR